MVGRGVSVKPVTDRTEVTEKSVYRPAFNFRTTARVVKPRRPYTETRPIVVVTPDVFATETSLQTGEVFPRADLSTFLLTTSSSIIACENASYLLRQLDVTFANFPGWTWRVTPVARRKQRGYVKTRVTETRDVVVNFFGWKYPRESGKSVFTFYHYPIDTLTFLGANAGDRPRDPFALLEWAIDVREFAQENALKVSPTSGGLAAQLLRDRRFFPENRRKVPRATNDKVREYLPGNHYELFVEENRTHDSALYLDMTGAHHHAASRVTFCDSNRLYARGRYRNPPTTIEGEPWARFGTPKYQSVIATHGLFLLRVNIPKFLKRQEGFFPPPWLRQPHGVQLAYVYSNELDLVKTNGAIIEGIEAAWTSSTSCRGLNRYGEWSLETSAAMTPLRKGWAKSTLLAAYGMLAARPQRREFGYRDAVRGEPGVYFTAGGPLDVKVLSTKKEVDSPIANVIARGMIEAEVRRDVLTLARELHDRGCRILALYADSIILSDDSALPLLPGHWRVKSELTRLEFFNPVTFHSEELTRMPGIPSREVVDRLRLREQMRDGSLTLRKRARRSQR